MSQIALMLYITLSMFKYQGKYYRLDDPIELSEEEAKPLLEMNLIRLAKEEDVDPADVIRSTDIDDIVTAIGMLDPDDKEHYTKSGVPKTDALSMRVGREISAEERDDAFAVFKALSE